MTGGSNSTSDGTGAVRIPDDAELLCRSKAGDQAAFRVLVDRHARYLYGVAYAMTGNEADGEDLVQETLAAMLESEFRKESTVRTWLVRILVNRAGMLRRKKKRWGSEREAIGTQRSEIPAADARLDLGAMLAVLSPEHRQVIVLREVQQMSYEQIAVALEIPRGTVESRLHRARAELRERFKEYLK